MEFYISKNSTLPIIKMQVVKDGRVGYEEFMSFIETSTIYFSMVDTKTGARKINRRRGGFVSKKFVDPNTPTEYYIYYKFDKKDVNRVGRYEGQFLLRNSLGTLVLPIRESLFINVKDSVISDSEPAINYVSLSAAYSVGSLVANYTASMTQLVNVDVKITFINSLGLYNGGKVDISPTIIIPANSYTGTTEVTLDIDPWSLNQKSSFSMLEASTTFSTIFEFIISSSFNFNIPTPTPTPSISSTQTPTPTVTKTQTKSPTPTPTIVIQSIIDAILIVPDLGYLDVGDGFYLQYIDPFVLEDPILTDDNDFISVGESLFLKYVNPTPLPAVSSTPTPTSSITPTPTPSITPSITPTITPTQSPAVFVPLTLYIQIISGGQAIIFDGVTYTADTEVSIIKNQSYNIEAVPSPGYMFVGWNIYGGSFSTTAQTTTVSVSLDFGANLAPSYSEDPNYDALEAQLSSNLVNYQNATDNNWVSITQEEYNNIFNNVDAVIKIGNSDDQVNTRDVATGWDTTTFGTIDANTPLTIPTGYYVVGFVAESWNQNGQVELGYTTTYHTGVPTYMGNSPNVIGGMTMFYVRKRPGNVEGAPASTDLYPVLNFIPPAYPNSVLNTFGWRTVDGGVTWVETVSAFETAKIQILLTNIRSWPLPPLPSQTPTSTLTQTPTPTPTITPNCIRQIVVNSLWDGETSINTNQLKLTQTSETLQIQVNDTITDFNGSKSFVGIVSSDGTYTYVNTGAGGGVAFDCQFPLTFSGTC